MHPILLRWGEAVVSTYAFLLSFAFFVALFTLFALTKGRIERDRVVNLSIGTFLSGLLGARLLHIAVHFDRFWNDPNRVFALLEGGVVYYGGFLGGAAFVLWRLRSWTRDARLTVIAAAFPALAWAQSVGRLGCFFNGCCFGRRCEFPWGVTFSDPHSVAEPLGVPLHPTQLYEAVATLFLGAGLFWFVRRAQRRGVAPARSARSSAVGYLFGYGVLRFLIEFTRGDLERGSAWGLSTSQWISIGLIGTAVVLLGSRSTEVPATLTHDE